jgi:hypothetical protein
MKLRRLRIASLVLFVLTVGLSTVPPPAVALPNPVATSDAELLAYGRVFPDPQGCLAYGVPDTDGDGIKDTPDGVSPYAKGQVCAEHFLGYDEVIAGSTFLQHKFPRFMRVIRLDQAYDNGNYMSAGVPTTFGFNEDDNPEVLSRDRRPLYLFKITDAQSPIPEKDRLHFAYSLSIHGIERAGLEGGIRAMEDLVTWAACESDPTAAPACAVDGPFPKRIVETPTSREVPTAEDVLQRSVIYFVPPNPDGWRRGEAGEGGVYFQRYNGNGVDLNRDWPTVGYSYRPYTPGSEPETKAYRDVLTGIRDVTTGKKFAGGIDLHGQLLAVAFSFTLLGSGQRDFRKNFSTVDQSLRAWEDQTKRLSWSPYIADANQNGQNDPGESCPNRNLLITSGNFPYCYADQWGTVVDTIGYQITGGLGDWFESPIGLGGVGIDNEMSASHIIPNTVFDPVNEQMHVDGNKGLIYSQLSSMLTEEDSDYVYEPPGKIGYVFDPRRVTVDAASGKQNPGLPAQNDIDTLVPCETDCQGGTFAMDGLQPTLEFDVRGPNEGIFNGGITVQATFTNIDGIGTGSIPRLKLERFDEEGGGQWQTAATSFVQGHDESSSVPDLYLQSGQVVSVNDPVPGRWRVRLTSLDGSPTRLEVDFHPTTADDNPGQAAIDASSMDFFDDLNNYVPAGQELTPVTVDEILANPAVLDDFDSLVVVDDFMPEFVTEAEPPFSGDPQGPISHTFGPEATVTGPDTFEFQVEGPPGADNDLMTVSSSWAVDSDWDIFVERQREDGSWEDRGCQCTFVAKGERLDVTAPEPGTWRIRLVNFAAAPQPVQVNIEFFSDPAIPDPGESKYGPEQFEQYAGALSAYANDGGNLVLTDGALQGLAAMGVVSPDQVGSSQLGGRGPVPRYEMNVAGRGNLCTPDSPDPLLHDVCLPGTAGGTARQAVEPTPLGYTPDATLDGAPRAKLTQYYVDRAAWEAGCGKEVAVECTSALLGAGVGYGELEVGSGRIRIAGAMLPDPNFAPGGPRDMRFGLSSYALTFSSWQMFLNLVNYQRPEPQPDLVVSDVTTATKVRGGRTAAITATIANQGKAQAGPSTTEFLLDGETVLGNVDTGSIPKGGSSDVSVSWNTQGVKGEHTIQATSDVGNALVEEDETNNAGVLTVQVQGNKVTNGSFEQASTGGEEPAAWTGTDTGAGETSWSDDGADGSSGAAITGTGGSVLLAGAPVWRSDPIEVVPGEVLDLVTSVQTDGTSSAPSVGLAYLGTAGQVLDTVKVLTAPLNTQGFVTLEDSVTIPAGVAEVRVVLSGFSATDTSTSGTVVFDDVGLYSS